DCKAREENLRIEEQKEKLRIEEQKEKLRIEEREEKLRFEQLRLDEQKCKDEFELEKLRIQLGADTSKESDTKFLVKEISKFIHRFDLKEDISLYLKLFERQAQRLNIDQENWVSHQVASDIFNKMGRTILLERRQTESVSRWDRRSTFLRSDWPKPFVRREVGVEIDWVDPKINDPRQGDLE
ncbi:hypothetical protein TNCV_4588921, partial [Trichonephila clavipes]